jgi:uncharacterized cysteine cluster protein YcgN (CxxCxxCC family)
MSLDSADHATSRMAIATIDRVDMDRFWENTPLNQMSPAQWEALCDRCGRCCLQKFKKPLTGKVYYTWVACYLLDLQTCRCSEYEIRRTLVPDCLELKPAKIKTLRWLPKTCAYRRMAEGRGLYDWHPLISGDPESVHTAGISVRLKAISETVVHPDDVDHFRIKERF